MTGKDAEFLAVKLTAYAYGGDALGRLPDGRAVFVPFGLPGETVKVRLVEEKRGHARGELVEVLESSPQRVSPFCRHYALCGGCHYQHVSYADQLAAKAGILRDQLQRIGGLADPKVLATVASPVERQYRNHVQFHLAADGRLGFHRMRSEEVLPVQECHLPEPALDETWRQLDFEAIPGLERIGLRLGVGEDIQLILESSNLELPEVSIEEIPLSVIHISPAGPLVLAGSPALTIDVLGLSFQVSAGSFFQVNTRMAEAMVEHLLVHLPKYAVLTPDTLLLDVYCGVGLFSAFLASRVGRLIGIETSPSATEDFEVNLETFDNVELYEAEAEIVLPGLKEKPDIILVDPPRSGIDRRAMDGLLALQAPLVVYISCDPSTLARDARRLVSSGYTLEQVTPFDLFPQTYHIESISFWRRSAG